MNKLTRFLYSGIYYPVFGSSSIFENNKYRNVYQTLVGGYGDNYGKFWTFNWGIKCRVWNRDKPYRQKIIDAIENHPEMNLKRVYFGEQDDVSASVYVVETDKGEYIGDITTAYKLSNLIDFRTCGSESPTVCYGYDQINNRACGWSHRAKICFGKGDKIFEVDGFRIDTPFREHGTEIIETYKDAMKAARNFAEYVS